MGEDAPHSQTPNGGRCHRCPATSSCLPDLISTLPDDLLLLVLARLGCAAAPSSRRSPASLVPRPRSPSKKSASPSRRAAASQRSNWLIPPESTRCSARIEPEQFLLVFRRRADDLLLDDGDAARAEALSEERHLAIDVLPVPEHLQHAPGLPRLSLAHQPARQLRQVESSEGDVHERGSAGMRGRRSWPGFGGKVEQKGIGEVVRWEDEGGEREGNKRWHVEAPERRAG